MAEHRPGGRSIRGATAAFLTALLVLGGTGAVTASAAGGTAAPAGADLPHPIGISAGRSFSCAIISDGTVWCTGANNGGQLGRGNTVDSAVPVQVKRRNTGLKPPVPLTKVVAVASGVEHNCALREDTSVWCWGRNYFGSLGDGTDTRRTTAVQVKKMNGDPLLNVVAVGAGAISSCAVTSGGAGWCWGDTNAAGVGDGTGEASFRAVRVKKTGDTFLTGVAEMDGGAYHICARTTDGAAWCMGSNSAGAIGDGTSQNRSRFTRVEKAGGGFLENVISISAGGETSCAVVSGGATFCWGTAMGTGTGPSDTTTDIRRATAVRTSAQATLSGRVAVSVGHDFGCALGADDGVRCWGRNDYGQVANGTKTTADYAVVAEKSGATPLSGVISLSAGGNHVCVTGTDLLNRCSGYNDLGALGDGTKITRTRAVPMVASWIFQ